MRTVVVLPTYCEAENIARLLHAVLRDPSKPDALIVDDSSPDGTGDMVSSTARRFSPGRVRLLTRRTKEGLGAAYRDGFALAIRDGYDVIVQMDADGSHPVSALRAMRREIDAGADLVLGSRYVPGGSIDARWPASRRLLSRGGNLYANLLLHAHTADLTGGFKMWRGSTLAKIDLTSAPAHGYAFQIQTTMAAIDAGARVREVPIAFTDRVHGTSKMHPGIVTEAMVAVLALSLRHRPHSPRPTLLPNSSRFGEERA